MTYPIKRDLDGVYFRVERDGAWENLCFSDLTPVERMRVTDGRGADWLLSLACILADALHDMGDALGVVRGGDAG